MLRLLDQGYIESLYFHGCYVYLALGGISRHNLLREKIPGFIERHDFENQPDDAVRTRLHNMNCRTGIEREHAITRHYGRCKDRLPLLAPLLRSGEHTSELQ